MGDRSEVNRKLLYAVRAGNLEKIQDLINHYGLSYLPDGSQGYVLLREATHLKRTEITKLLLRSGCRVNSKSGNPSMTPLHFAAENDDIDVVQMLLDEGALVDINDKNGRTPLTIAVERQNLLIAADLLNRGASVHNSPRSSKHSGRTLLHIACEKNNDKLVEILLCNHAYVKATDRDGSTPLHIAIQHGNLKIVDQLLIYGADVRSQCILKGKRNYTALHLAAQTGNEEIIKLLLSKGPTIDARTEDKLTPLHIAIENAHETVARICLEHGADVNAKSVDNQTPLNLAAAKSSLTMIREVLRYKPDSSDEYNRLALCSAVRKCGCDSKTIVADLLDYGLAISPQDINDGSLLCGAVEKGHEKIVEDLLKYGADANYSDFRTWNKIPLLHLATRRGKDSIIKLLINYGADVNSKDSTGCTPIYIAVGKANLEVTKRLLDNKAYIEDHFDLLLLAVNTGNTNIVATLLNSNVNINAENMSGIRTLYSPFFIEHTDYRELRDIFENNEADFRQILHIAVYHGRKEMVKLLLDHTVDINSVLNYDITPLHLAAFTGRESITTMILDKGANVNVAHENGVTALYMACVKGHNKVVEILLNSGAELNYGEKNGGVLLHAATWGGHAKVVELLLKYDVDIDFKDDEGETSLHIASQRGHKNIIEVLLRYNADIDSKNHEDETALFIASRSGYANIIQILLKHNADINFKNNDGDTALHIASLQGHAEVVEVLLRYNADIDSKNIEDETALHIASQKGYVNVTDILLEHGSDINNITKRNSTALDFATAASWGWDLAAGMGDHCIPERRTVIEYLRRHIIKLTAANLYLNEKNVRSMDSFTFKDFRSNCEEEIKNMKSEKIVNNISFYDILTKGMNRLTAYLKNENVMHASTTGNYKTKFPIYASMINLRFKKGIKRNDLLDQSYRSFDILCDSFSMLPRVCVDNIFSFFSNFDLEKLINTD